ncbi:MAG: adenylate/guanylate cyclase domain-containing protein [Verrucomicrobiota bacterium]
MKIRWKLFLALALVVAGGTVGTLWLAERQFETWVRAQVLEVFQRDVDSLLAARQERLAEVQVLAGNLADHEVIKRLATSDQARVSTADRTAMRLAYTSGLRPKSATASEVRPARNARQQATVMPSDLPLMGVVTNTGERVFVSRRKGRLAASWKSSREFLQSSEAEGAQVVGYGLLDERTADTARVKEVVITPIKVDGQPQGWFFLGRDAGSREERVLAKYNVRDSWTGLWVDGEWFPEGEPPLDSELTGLVEGMLDEQSIQSTEPRLLEWQDTPYLLMARELNPDSPVGKGAQVALFSLDRLDRAVTNLRRGVAMLTGLALLLAVVTAWWMSRRFSGPILKLVEATEKVRQGDLAWKVPVKGRDEFATLATDFNRMTDDLSLKEKFRDLLSKTSDPVVANRLMQGSLELGGELRESAVVFCDIRGFTATTDGMAPAEVIHLLNDHMTAMTQVIYKHHGVVDKFVGDLVMAVFGAPVASDDDVSRAAACAIDMVRVRAELNQQLKEPVEIGVGLAAGEIVSGLMGSEDRLNYTVLGDRVNLASRLCSLAEAGEVLVDGITAEKLGDGVAATPRGTMEVRGFRSEVAILALDTDLH